MKWLAIANPAAGRAREGDRLVGRLRGMREVDADVAHTTEPGSASRLVREGSAYDGVIAIGGDGTICEVLQGLDLARQRLAVLPAGHGNCLARDLGVADPSTALAAVRGGKFMPLDLMDVTVGYADGSQDRRLCASTLAVGYVTDVVEFGRLRLPMLGRAAYAVAAMMVAPKWFEARVDGALRAGASTRYTGLVVNNTAHLANFRGLPDASVRDGLIDVMELGHAWPRQMLHNVSVLAGSRAFGPRRLRQAQRESLEFGEALTLMADGELLRDVVRIDVDCRAGAVSCAVGEQ